MPRNTLVQSCLDIGFHAAGARRGFYSRFPHKQAMRVGGLRVGGRVSLSRPCRSRCGSSLPSRMGALPSSLSVPPSTPNPSSIPSFPLSLPQFLKTTRSSWHLYIRTHLRISISILPRTSSASSTSCFAATMSSLADSALDAVGPCAVKGGVSSARDVASTHTHTKDIPRAPAQSPRSPSGRLLMVCVVGVGGTGNAAPWSGYRVRK